MRILIVRTFPEVLDIQAYNVQEIGLAKALVRKGHQCDIVLYGGKNSDHSEQYSWKDGELGKLQFTIYWLKGYNFVKNGFMPSVKKIILDYDVIQVDEYDLIGSWQLYTKQLVPTVVYHGLYASQYTKGYNLKCSVFDKLFLWQRSIKNVVALTKSELAASFLRDKGFNKVHAVGVGLDESRFNKKEGETCLDDFKGKGTLKLLYVGKLEDRRNSIWLLKLLEELLYNRKLPIHMTIVGKGDTEYQKEFDTQARKLIGDGYLEVVPKASQEEMPRYYEASDLFVFPSNYEIFGMVLLEAMYFGLPVVSSYNGGSSTLIENNINGVIVDSFDVNIWADNIERLLLEDDKLKNMSEIAQKTIHEKYLWDRIVDRFIYAYIEAIKSV